MKYSSSLRSHEYEDLIKKKMRDIILDAGQSFSQAAKSINTDRRVFVLHCTQVRLSLWILYKFCKHYKVSADYLLGLKEQK